VQPYCRGAGRRAATSAFPNDRQRRRAGLLQPGSFPDAGQAAVTRKNYVLHHRPAGPPAVPPAVGVRRGRAFSVVKFDVRTIDRRQTGRVLGWSGNSSTGPSLHAGAEWGVSGPRCASRRTRVRSASWWPARPSSWPGPGQLAVAGCGAHLDVRNGAVVRSGFRQLDESQEPGPSSLEFAAYHVPLGGQSARSARPPTRCTRRRCVLAEI